MTVKEFLFFIILLLLTVLSLVFTYLRLYELLVLLDQLHFYCSLQFIAFSLQFCFNGSGGETVRLVGIEELFDLGGNVEVYAVGNLLFDAFE